MRWVLLYNELQISSVTYCLENFAVPQSLFSFFLSSTLASIDFIIQAQILLQSKELTELETIELTQQNPFEGFSILQFFFKHF